MALIQLNPKFFLEIIHWLYVFLTNYLLFCQYLTRETSQLQINNCDFQSLLWLL